MKRVVYSVWIGLVALSLLLPAMMLLCTNVQAAVWSIEVVDSTGDVGLYASLALDDNGNPHVAYFDATNGHIKHGAFTGRAWTIGTADSSGLQCLWLDLAVDGSGNPHICYELYNDNDPYMITYDLMYVYWNGTAWVMDTILSQNEGYYHPSIAVTSSGTPHVSYFDPLSGDLIYTTRMTGAWKSQTVHWGNFYGDYSSITLDSYNRAHISYYVYYHYYAVTALYYARWSGTNWDVELVDSADQTNDAGMYSSLALISSEQPRISYYDITNDALMYARWTGTVWETETVDSEGDVGAGTSLALDQNGNPHICYFDATNNDVKYARQSGSTWDIEIVEGSGNVGRYLSMALDGSDLHVGYYDITNRDIKYAYGRQTSATVPGAPQNFAAMAGNGQVTLTWQAPSSSGGSTILNYIVYRGTSTGTGIQLANLGDVLTYTDDTVINGQTYYYQVSAVNVIGEGARATEVSATPMLIIPGASDQDGLPDDWENTNFGNLNYGPAAAPDQDGYVNLQEHESDTDPMDETSAPGTVQEGSSFIDDILILIIVILIVILVIETILLIKK